MPNTKNAQPLKAAGSNEGYSPRLCNEDLAPTRDQNWSWYNIFSFWMSDVHSMGGYVVAASFFTLGLASWQVLLCLLAGICIVQLCANLGEHLVAGNRLQLNMELGGVTQRCRAVIGLMGALFLPNNVF